MEFILSITEEAQLRQQTNANLKENFERCKYTTKGLSTHKIH